MLKEYKKKREELFKEKTKLVRHTHDDETMGYLPEDIVINFNNQSIDGAYKIFLEKFSQHSCKAGLGKCEICLHIESLKDK